MILTSGKAARAHVIGSGPNGLAAAITLAQAGIEVTVFEAQPRIGGACASAEFTLPGFVHDLGSSAYPMGAASPFFRSLPLQRFGLRWVQPEFAVAHPLDGGVGVGLARSLGVMAEQLGAADGVAWTRMFAGLVDRWEELVPEILGPVVHVPRHGIALAKFGLPALLPATTLAKNSFTGERARALFAGCAAHSVMPLEAPLSAAIGLVLGTAGHAVGWPVIGGGAQHLSDALAACLHELGGQIHTDMLVENLEDLPPAEITLFDTGTKALASIAAERLSPGYRSSLRDFKAGPGAFKVDWALSGPMPWTAEVCRRAATVHVGGTLEEIAAAERAVFDGRCSDRPFVLLVQPTICDPSRAPAGKHTAWGYCHVPNGSTIDRTAAIEAQVERFAPGFRDCILARRTWTTGQLESWNPNLVGGDLSGGAMTAKQMLFRPTVREYGTSDPGVFLCSSSTPPGGGVHGMAGFHAARLALRSIRA